MSLATRCPECGTTFKVVRDQLRISDGWVRCGRCSHVFDGTEHLHDPDAPVDVAPAPHRRDADHRRHRLLQRHPVAFAERRPVTR